MTAPSGTVAGGAVTVQVDDPAAQRAADSLARWVSRNGTSGPADLDELASGLASVLGCGVRIGAGDAVAIAVPTPAGLRCSGTAAVALRPEDIWQSITVRAECCEAAVEDAIRAAALGSGAGAYLSRRRRPGALVDRFGRVLRIGHHIDPLPVG